MGISFRIAQVGNLGFGHVVLTSKVSMRVIEALSRFTRFSVYALNFHEAKAPNPRLT